jgi:hypothetical protein
MIAPQTPSWQPSSDRRQWTFSKAWWGREASASRGDVSLPLPIGAGTAGAHTYGIRPEDLDVADMGIAPKPQKTHLFSAEGTRII